MSENISIRLEQEGDFHTVEVVTREAFSYPERIERSKIGCPLEHYMVHILRKELGIAELSFVAEISGEIVGHVIYSDAHIRQPDGSKVHVLNLGPVSVLPKYQRSGVGSALMLHSIEQAKKLGYGAIFFFGRPEYYPRFGFVEASVFGITTVDGCNFPGFFAMELNYGYLSGVAGAFVEPDIFNDDLNREQAREYDLKFFRQ